jgi:hypothetical protein
MGGGRGRGGADRFRLGGTRTGATRDAGRLSRREAWRRRDGRSNMQARAKRGEGDPRVGPTGHREGGWGHGAWRLMGPGGPNWPAARVRVLGPPFFDFLFYLKL